MAQRAGSANLPLHGGQVPKWLADRMTRLGAVMSEAIVHHYGRDELLRRLAHPFWFQSFGAVMGMDWHSSGITTSVIGALKRGLAPLSRRARHPCLRRPRQAFAQDAARTGRDRRAGRASMALRSRNASRLVAKVDSAAVQDGFELYLHGFIVTDDGHWVVVQQGMNGERRQARRYHWLSEGLTSFVDAAACGDRRAGAGRDRQPHRPSRGAVAPRPARAARVAGPDGIARELPALEARPSKPRCRYRACATDAAASGHARRITMCARATSSLQRLHGDLAAAADRGPVDFRRSAAHPGRRRAHGACAGHGGRGRARRALSFHRSGAVFVRPWRQGPASVPGAAQGL